MSAIDPLNKYKVDSFKDTDKLQSPRTIKTHLAYHILPRELSKKGKVIIIIIFDFNGSFLRVCQ